MRRLISVAVASAMVVGSAGSALAHKAKKGHKHRAAQHHVQQPYAYNQHRRSGDNGAALAFGMLAIGTIAAIAASKSGGNVNFGYGHQYPPQAYGPPPGYGYGPAGYGYGAPAYAPPVYEREREKVVEYRREYERERIVGGY